MSPAATCTPRQTPGQTIEVRQVAEVQAAERPDVRPAARARPRSRYPLSPSPLKSPDATPTAGGEQGFVGVEAREPAQVRAAEHPDLRAAARPGAGNDVRRHRRR